MSDIQDTGDLDVEQVGDLGARHISPNSLGLLVVYEQRWSVPFALAARKAGGQLVAQGHIPTQAILAALDALELEGN